jgi:uroporphyrinogen-III decarboxylase
MDNLQSKYQKRNEKSMELVNNAFSFKEAKEVPFIFNTANYFSFGYPEEELPEDYYTSIESMYNRQIEQFQRHYDLLEDNFVPYLMPWYGTGVTASAFGVPVGFPSKMDPTTDCGIIDRPEDIDRIQVPDPEKDGLMPKVLETIKYFQENSNLPINFTDNHGPLTLAVQVLGYEKLFIWMYEHPEKVHKLMDILADTVIVWIKAQKKLMGHAYDYCIGNQGVPVGEGVGVWFSDDDNVIISKEHYEEFAMPYHDKVLEAFGGGIIHYCGTANQHIPNFQQMKHLKGINNFALGDVQGTLELKKGLDEKKITLVACDFTHYDYTDYYSQLFEQNNMTKEGLVVQSLFSPMTGVKDGKYEFITRDDKTVADDMKNVMKRFFR